MLIHIVNWDKFNNPRKDVKSTSWFRFQNDFFTDPDFCDLPHDQKLVFPYLCSVASAKMRGEFEIAESMVCRILGITPTTIEDALFHLQNRGIIKIPTARTRNVRVTRPSRVRNAGVEVTSTDTSRNGRTDGRTDGTDGRNGTDEHTGADTPGLANPPEPGPEAPDPADLAVGVAWLEYAQGEMPWQRGKKSWTPEAFAHEVGKIRRSLGMTETGMAEVLAFVRADDFWRDKACSPSGLLKKSQNGNRKIDNVLLAMKSRGAPAVDRNIDAARRWAEGS